MTTLGEAKTTLARLLRDTDNQVFDTDMLGDFISSAVAEVGRVAPRRFQEDLDPVSDQLSYVLLSADFLGEEVPEIELVRVELWDVSVLPIRAVKLLQPQSAEQVRYSNAGWVLWGGRLELPNRFVDSVTGLEEIYLIRVWGYAPYVKPAADGDVLGMSHEVEDAMMLFARIEAIRALIGSRMLFTQWQTRTNNTDVSPAAMMNELNIAMEEWRRKSRAIFVLREAP